jgi:hypothetical protein
MAQHLGSENQQAIYQKYPNSVNSFPKSIVSDDFMVLPLFLQV